MGKISIKKTDESFLLRLLDLPELLSDTGWLDRMVTERSPSEDDHADIALLVAAAQAYRESAVYARRSFFAAAGRGRPRSMHESLVTVDCRLGEEKYRLAVQRVSPKTYRIDVESMVITMTLDPVSEFESRVTIGDQSYHVVSVTQGQDHLIEVDNVIHRVSRGDVGTIRSPFPSLVVAVNVKPGDSVIRGDSLVVLESDKASMEVPAPVSVTRCPATSSGPARYGNVASVFGTSLPAMPSSKSSKLPYEVIKEAEFCIFRYHTDCC